MLHVRNEISRVHNTSLGRQKVDAVSQLPHVQFRRRKPASARAIAGCTGPVLVCLLYEVTSYEHITRVAMRHDRATHPWWGSALLTCREGQRPGFGF